MAKSKEFIESLEDKAWDYITECNNRKEVKIINRKRVDVIHRKVPTIEYFLRIWLPQSWHPDSTLNGETINRKTWYNWLLQQDENGVGNDKCNTIKRIDSLFKAQAIDIVADEDRSIFYAKNRLGMTDRRQVDTTANVSFLSVDPIKSEEKE